MQLEYTDIFDDNKQKKLVFSKELLPKRYNEKSLFALIVDGESMQPLIQDRAVVVCDLSLKELEDEAIYILYHGDKMWIKKYNQKDETFVSINPDYRHLVYKKVDIYLVGKVLVHF
ncbi:MAG: S24 family peptidase [Arcobacteraceae bacterium]